MNNLSWKADMLLAIKATVKSSGKEITVFGWATEDAARSDKLYHEVDLDLNGRVTRKKVWHRNIFMVHRLKLRP